MQRQKPKRPFIVWLVFRQLLKFRQRLRVLQRLALLRQNIRLLAHTWKATRQLTQVLANCRPLRLRLLAAH